MAQYLHVGLYLEAPFTNLPFGICAIYFDLKVNKCLFQVRSWHILTTVDDPEFKKKHLRAKGVGRNVEQWWTFLHVFSHTNPGWKFLPHQIGPNKNCPKIAWKKKEHLHLPTINFQPAFCWLVWRARGQFGGDKRVWVWFHPEPQMLARQPRWQYIFVQWITT